MPPASQTQPFLRAIAIDQHLIASCLTPIPKPIVECLASHRILLPQGAIIAAVAAAKAITIERLRLPGRILRTGESELVLSAGGVGGV